MSTLKGCGCARFAWACVRDVGESGDDVRMAREDVGLEGLDEEEVDEFAACTDLAGDVAEDVEAGVSSRGTRLDGDRGGPNVSVRER